MPEFWDTFEGRPSGEFISGREKDEMIANKEPFEIVGVKGPMKTQFGEQYYLEVRQSSNPDTQKIMTFSADSNVTSRNDMLEQMRDFLQENPDETIVVKLVLNGRVKLLEPV